MSAKWFWARILTHLISREEKYKSVAWVSKIFSREAQNKFLFRRMLHMVLHAITVKFTVNEHCRCTEKAAPSPHWQNWIKIRDGAWTAEKICPNGHCLTAGKVASLNFFQAIRKQSSSLVLSFYLNLKKGELGSCHNHGALQLTGK